MNYQTLTSSWGFVPVPPLCLWRIWILTASKRIAGTTIYTMQGSVHSPHLVVKGQQ